MSRTGTIARRGFLIGAAAVAGGVVFGVYKVRQPVRNPLLADLAEGEAAITPYLRLTAQGITLITPRADLGQGAYAVQALLIAEELDVTLDQVMIDPGPPAPAYWNTALSSEVAAFLAPGGGVLGAVAQGGVDAAMKLMGVQITGGSTTVPDGFDKLRMAGAVARETLKAAAAARTGLEAATLRTAQGAVILPDDTRLPYTDLAAEAARIAPVTEVRLRAPSDWRLIGQSLPRLDMAAKCTGTQVYGIDLRIEGMLQAAVALNPAQGGALLGFDATKARQMRGVRAVLPVTGGVAVVADNTWRAFQAAEAITAEWGPAPFPASMQTHWQALSDAFAPAHRDSRKRDDGDVDRALGDADVIEAAFRAPYLAHAPLEPLSAVVRVDEDRADEDRAEIWCGTQIPRFVQDNVSAITGIPTERITLHAQMVGGSFGHRLEDDVIRHAAEIAMQMKGTPIKLTYRREEDMRHDYPRQIAMARMRGAVADGKVTALDLGIAMPSVIASQMSRQTGAPPGPDSQIVAGAWDQALAIPHLRVTGYRAPELAPISSWRSVGASSNGFFFNAALDILIHAAGADPLTERLRLCDDALTRKVLEAVAEMSGWTGPTPAPGKGRGVALTMSFGVPCAEVIEVTLGDDGIRIDHVWVAAEVGVVVDPVNFENQVQGGVIWGLGHAMNCALTYTDGIADQVNFDGFTGMRIAQCPAITVRGLENGTTVRGIGEPAVPPAAPALAGAIFAATGTRLREMPFDRSIRFA